MGCCRAALPTVPRLRRCMPSTFDEAVTRPHSHRKALECTHAKTGLCRALARCRHGSHRRQCDLRQAHRRRDSCVYFVLFRVAVASVALATMARSEQGPSLAGMSLGKWRDLVLMALLGFFGFTMLMLEGLKRDLRALPPPCRSRRLPPPRLLGETIGPERIAGTGLVIAGSALGALGPTVPHRQPNPCGAPLIGAWRWPPPASTAIHGLASRRAHGWPCMPSAPLRKGRSTPTL